MNIKKIFNSVFVLTLTLQLQAKTPEEEGKAIFQNRCAACHNVNKVMTGPALAGISERRSIDWIIKFVQSSQSVIKSGDESAVKLFNQFNKIPMPDHPDLTEENIKNIVAYIKSDTKTEEPATAPFAKPGKKRPYYPPVKLTNYFFVIGYLAVVLALIATYYYAVQFKTFKKDVQHKNESD
ncbi:MAG TPA: cytochrome c [Chitinophagaceae bacterium]|nr:cytochrome c [Chitinophagaceae bacterium]